LDSKTPTLGHQSSALGQLMRSVWLLNFD